MEMEIIIKELEPVLKPIITKENNDRFQCRLSEFTSSDYYLKKKEEILLLAQRFDKIRDRLSNLVYWNIVLGKIRKGESIKGYLDGGVSSKFIKRMYRALGLGFFTFKKPTTFTSEQILLLEEEFREEFSLYDEFQKIESYRSSFPHLYEKSSFNYNYLINLPTVDFVYYHFTEFESLSIDKIDKDAFMLLIRLEILKCKDVNEIYDYLITFPVIKNVKLELEKVLYG